MGISGQITELNQAVRMRRRQLEADRGRAMTLAEQGKSAVAQASAARANAELYEQARVVLNEMADARQEEVRERLESIVSYGLQLVFADPDLHFRVVQEVKRNRVEVTFTVASRMGTVVIDTDVLEARGGGMANVVGFLVRVVVLLMRPRARRILFLDETFAQLSEEYEGRMAEFMRELVDKAGVQIVMVTHSQAYNDVADVVHTFSQTAGVTNVRSSV